MAPKSGFEMCLFCSSFLGPIGGGGKTRLRTPKAVTYHEPNVINPFHRINHDRSQPWAYAIQYLKKS